MIRRLVSLCVVVVREVKDVGHNEVITMHILDIRGTPSRGSPKRLSKAARHSFKQKHIRCLRA